MGSEPDHAPGAARHRTAIERVGASRPLSVALADGVITASTTVFDYGCGRGGDLRIMRARGIRADGWDPHFAPSEELASANVVTLGYVLNVIEDPAERADTLRRAFELALDVLVIAVRIEQGLGDIPELRDGVVTERGTFQKYYSQREFLDYVQDTLACRMHVPALGVGYVFKKPEVEQRYVASLAYSRSFEFRPDLIQRFQRDRIAAKYVQLATQLGRMPRAEEFEGYGDLVSAYGSPGRVQRLTAGAVIPQAFRASREDRRSDMLVFGALLRLQGVTPPHFKTLPASVQADVRALWGSYTKALNEADHFLYSLGSPEVVKAACDSSRLGKRLPGSLYVHRSAEEDLPPLLRVVVHAAKRIIGALSYDVTKIGTDGKAVSFLSYPGFDEIGHPQLSRSVRVYMPKATAHLRDYTGSLNRPILHRKDALVSQDYPHYASFLALTDQEDAAGLLSSPDIGTASHWESLLSARRLRVNGHTLLHL